MSLSRLSNAASSLVSWLPGRQASEVPLTEEHFDSTYLRNKSDFATQRSIGVLARPDPAGGKYNYTLVSNMGNYATADALRKLEISSGESGGGGAVYSTPDQIEPGDERAVKEFKEMCTWRGRKDFDMLKKKYIERTSTTDGGSELDSTEPRSSLRTDLASLNRTSEATQWEGAPIRFFLLEPLQGYELLSEGHCTHPTLFGNLVNGMDFFPASSFQK